VNFVAVGDSTIYSPTGASWTTAASGAFSSGGYSVIYDGTYVIATGNDATKQIKISSDHGSNWTNVTSLTGFSSYGQSLATTSNLTADFQVTNTLYVTPGRIGINCNAPLYELDVKGNIRSSNVVYPSDRRLKSNIQTIEHSLSTIQSLRGVFYTMQSETKRSIGLIAQEVQEILPEVVHTDASSEKMLSINYAPIVSLLIEGIKELSDKYTILQSTLAAHI
jgi:hypothetical protein